MRTFLDAWTAPARPPHPTPVPLPLCNVAVAASQRPRVARASRLTPRPWLMPPRYPPPQPGGRSRRFLRCLSGARPAAPATALPKGWRAAVSSACCCASSRCGSRRWPTLTRRRCAQGAARWGARLRAAAAHGLPLGLCVCVRACVHMCMCAHVCVYVCAGVCVSRARLHPQPPAWHEHERATTLPLPRPPASMQHVWNYYSAAAEARADAFRARLAASGLPLEALQDDSVLKVRGTWAGPLPVCRAGPLAFHCARPLLVLQVVAASQRVGCT